MAGLGLVVAMQMWFALTAVGRPPAYLPVQAFSALGTLAAAWGLARLERGGAAWIAAGLGVNVLGRLLQLALQLTRLPIWLNVAFALAFGFAMLVAIAWATGRPRLPRLRLAFALLAFVHFLAMLHALARLEAAIGLALGTAGFAMTAAFVDEATMTRR